MRGQSPPGEDVGAWVPEGKGNVKVDLDIKGAQPERLLHHDANTLSPPLSSSVSFSKLITGYWEINTQNQQIPQTQTGTRDVRRCG